MQLPAGSARPVAVSLPEPLADLPLAEEEIRTRATRLLPLSGKADGALRELAACYLSWLDARDGEGDTETMLADMVWTAGVGTESFWLPGRCGVPRCRVVAGWAEDDRGQAAERPPVAATKVAFAFTGEGSEWVGMGQALYESEPVVRAVLDRCDAALREERDACRC